MNEAMFVAVVVMLTDDHAAIAEDMLDGMYAVSFAMRCSVCIGMTADNWQSHELMTWFGHKACSWAIQIVSSGNAKCQQKVLR